MSEQNKVVKLETPDYGDQELTAMGQVAKALEPLSQEARDRVLRWGISRFVKTTK